MADSIVLRQTNPADRTNPHTVTQMVLSPLTAGPLSRGGLLQEVPQTASIREFLFEMRKDGAVYWVGAAVPEGTSDFSKAQVFFHPTVVQRTGHRVTVHAAENDYPTFRGGWSGSLQRYVAMQGGQLAGARKTALIVPFMTMAAFGGRAPAYIFATRPVETLNAIMTAVRDAAMSNPSRAEASSLSSAFDALADAVNQVAIDIMDAVDPVRVEKIGVSSFSSGIGAMRLFVGSFDRSGLIAETTDFDGPFIVGMNTTVRAHGAAARVFSQVAPRHRQPGWVTLPPPSFRNINTFRDKGPHAQIGWMSFYMASLGSAIT